MVKRIYLVRHCESTLQGRYCGRRSDPPLSSIGLTQAVLLAQAFRDAPLGAIWSSSRARAIDTAGEIARRRGAAARIDARLDELDFGAWDGLSHQEVAAGWAKEYAEWSAAPEGTRPPEGETAAELADRAWSFFVEAVRSETGNAVIVSHGGPIRMILVRLLSMPTAAQWRLAVDTASISAVDCFDDGFRLLVYSNRDASSGLPAHSGA